MSQDLIEKIIITPNVGGIIVEVHSIVDDVNGKTEAHVISRLLEHAARELRGDAPEGQLQIPCQGPGRLPTIAHRGDAGADLCATGDWNVPAKGRTTVDLGLHMAIPEGYVGLIHPRSGLASKHGITVLNTPGTIDSGYRGSIGVVLMNTGNQAFSVKNGDRIAQLVIQKVESPVYVWSDSLDDTDRGAGGFGSTGRE